MTNWKYLKSLTENEFAKWLYEIWLNEPTNYEQDMKALIYFLNQERKASQEDLNKMAISVLKEWMK